MRSPPPEPAMSPPSPGGDKVSVLVSFYLYGEGAEDVAAREEPAWQEWMGERFPAPAEATATTG
jgi:hypothetical protein